jgi:uncharacterized membrane protein YdjX (TVP38/TMEM64 family)
MVPVESERACATAGTRPRWRRWVPLALLALAAALVFATGWYRYLSLETVVRNRTALALLVEAHFALALAAFLAIYITTVSLSIPGALLLTIASGILFGWLAGGLTVMVGATVGGTITFLIAKSVCGEYVVRRAGPRLSRIVRGFRADAFSYLLFLRLVPLFPFVLVNIAPALVGVPLRTFVTATALGVIPATFVFAGIGAGLDSAIRAQEIVYRACIDAGRPDCRLDFDASAAATPELIAALIALGVLALVPVLIKRVYSRRSGPIRSAHRRCRRAEGERS